MPTDSEHRLNYLALGDSYTVGESVDENQRWPQQLVAKLREQDIPIADPVIIARTGWTTEDLVAAIGEQYDGETYDIVSVLAGVNDQYRGYAIEVYREHFRELLAFAISAAGARPDRVIVLSIPDWGVTPFAEGRDREQIAAAIDAFNAVNRAESEAAGVAYFDITPISRTAAENTDMLAYDGLHPSGEMYAAWVEVLLDQVVGILIE